MHNWCAVFFKILLSGKNFINGLNDLNGFCPIAQLSRMVLTCEEIPFNPFLDPKTYAAGQEQCAQCVPLIEKHFANLFALTPLF